jgi:hypothetical protein
MREPLGTFHVFLRRLMELWLSPQRMADMSKKLLYPKHACESIAR